MATGGVPCRPGCDFERRATEDLKRINEQMTGLCRTSDRLNEAVTQLLAAIAQLALESADD